MKEITTLPIIERDEWLQPVAGEVIYRHNLYLDALAKIEGRKDRNDDYPHQQIS